MTSVQNFLFIYALNLHREPAIRHLLKDRYMSIVRYEELTSSCSS